MSKILIPRLNPNDEFVILSRWLVQDGQAVKKGDAVAELVSSKIVFVLHAEQEGYLYILKEKHQKIKVGEPIGDIHETAKSNKELQAAKKPVGASTSSGSSGIAVFSEPAKILLSKVGGNERDFFGAGLVTEEQVREKYQAHKLRVRTNVQKSEEISWAKRAEIEALSIGSRALVSRLKVQLLTAPLREKLQQKQIGLKSLTPLILFETFRLVSTKYQKLNSSFADDHIIYHKSLNLGLALDVGNGLKVANLKLTPESTPAAIEERIVELTLSDLRGTTLPEDFSATTFTVTDLSQFQILDFDPLINGDQAAILGIGADLAAPHSPLQLILAFDHRILSGREVAEFLNDLKKSVLSYGND